MMSNVSMDSSSWSFSSKGFHNTAEIDPFSAVYALKKQNWTGNRVLGGKACPVLIKVGNSQTTHFVTSSDVVAFLEATGIRNPTEMHPFPQMKMKRCRLEANSAVNNFGPFSFLSMNINSSPGLKTCPELTLLDFQVPGPKLDTNFQAYTFAGSKKVTLKFVYEKASGKHVLSKYQGDQLEQPFVLGAPVIMEDKAVTCLLSSSRWPVVGVVGLDDELEVCPYFVKANMFADSFSTSQIQIGESCEGSSRSSGVAHARDLGAQECYELSLKKAGQAGDRATERKAILKLGIVYSSRGDHRQAIECYTKGLDIAKEAVDLVGVKLAQERLRKSYLDIGDTHLFCSGSDHQQAIECYTKSLDIAKEAGHLAGVKLAHERLQKSYLDLGDTHLFCSRVDHGQAIKFYTKSLDIAKEAGDLLGVKLAQERLWKSYLDLGDTHLFCSSGDHQQAIEFYTKSIDIAKEAGDLVGVKRAQERRQKSYLDLGDIQLLCSHGDRPQAIGFYTKALDLAKEAGDLAGEKIAEERLQKSHLDLGVNWSCYRLCQKAIPKQGERLAPGNESNATAADENFPSNHEKGQSCYKHTEAMLL